MLSTNKSSSVSPTITRYSNYYFSTISTIGDWYIEIIDILIELNVVEPINVYTAIICERIIHIK